MKPIKILGLIATAAATLMALAGTASATITNPSGTPYTGNIQFSSSNLSFDGSVKIACQSSTTGFSIVNGSTTGSSALSFSGCGADTMNVLENGSLAIASSGAVTSTGAVITMQLHRSVLGFPVTWHCLYITNMTNIGTLTEGVAPAVLHIGAAPIPEAATDGACGNDMVWTGSYTVASPSGAITVD